MLDESTELNETEEEEIESLRQLIRAARGEIPADLVLTNARIVNTITGEIEPGRVAIYKGVIAGIGDYQGQREMDLAGRYLCPGFINGHTHPESSHLSPAQYARAVVPRGTTTIVTDLHEVANVSGVAGIRYLLDRAQRLPLDIFFMVPPCVPATKGESSGKTIGVEQMAEALFWPEVIGLGEMMDFPSVLRGSGEVLQKLLLAPWLPQDGHAPGLRGKDLNAYIAAGINSDHESITLDEAQEKLRRGLWLMIREGSSEKNLETLLPLALSDAYRHCFFVTDDRTPADLLREGEIDAVLRKAIALGVNPVRAIQMATINPAEYFGLPRLGALVPGYMANMVVLSDLASLQVEGVFYTGILVAEGGKALFSLPRMGKSRFASTIRIAPVTAETLKMPATRAELPIIEVVPGQIVTRKRWEKGRIVRDEVVADPGRDLLKLTVVERHRASGRAGVGLVKGFGLKSGALASSLAHDSHNIIAVGASDEDILLAIQEVARLQGGMVVAHSGKVIASLPLPLFGLLSVDPVEQVAQRAAELEAKARQLGCSLPAPFAALSFLALPVIPEIRLTDRGLVDGATGQPIS